MAAPVATARVLNGAQDTPIDSDDAPYFKAKTGIVIPFGFAPTITAQVPFISQATRADITATGFAPQGVFVGAFVKPATRADIIVQGLSPALAIVSWLTIPAVQIDRTAAFPQYINNVRATYLSDPGALVTSVALIDETVAFDAVVGNQAAPAAVSLAVGRNGTMVWQLFGSVSQDWAHPTSATVGDIYEAKLTAITGTTTGAAMNTYLPLTQLRTWTVAASASFTGTLVIRRVGDATDLDSASVSLTGGV